MGKECSMRFKPVANSAVLDATHVQCSDSRFQRILNTHASSIANVEIGTASDNVVKTVLVPGKDAGAACEVIIDVGSADNYISLNTNVTTVYRTPVAGDN
tara:strand:+ start:24 stop:323 length:300 start_codon:yes stop_codon:yes gene_type:complete